MMGHCHCSFHLSITALPQLLCIRISPIAGSFCTSTMKKQKQSIDDTATSLWSLMMCHVLRLFTFISHCTTLFHTSCTLSHFIQTSLQLPLRHFWSRLQKWFPEGSSHKGLVHQLLSYHLNLGFAYFTHSPEQLTQRGSPAANAARCNSTVTFVSNTK